MAFVRITARIDEVVSLIAYIRMLLTSLDLTESSFIPPVPIESISGKGVGVVEAPRGSLIHRATVEKEKIVSYSIITPSH
ncbi:MAG: nickel-dependent hydrogenase large subunit [Sulfuricurvum sp.]|uniref:nickel-dependent hydrogenase large subunit n=1 Tax=Sulfuricurvum sp. TaxID=2025608 RepID=UPI002633FA53|nr:nickel-dependent hydrogenase large subunit [Sulfuricurvum sp.]MDD2370171.1 nickel-dependent hydrogenase large subunit [Sulfuricurvum sp.]MDD2951254.1 nickel-dependent hydrogenase large subunit [Sulfuricurvum sp.]MDD5117025.1 nickel-dependent hydrogenase large subunit [Sulfuricurvum sp.]